jgi:hypothetical protein
MEPRNPALYRVAQSTERCSAPAVECREMLRPDNALRVKT